jgi:hypothetical protein
LELKGNLRKKAPSTSSSDKSNEKRWDLKRTFEFIHLQPLMARLEARRGTISQTWLWIASIILVLIGIIILTAFNPSLKFDREFVSGILFGTAVGILFTSLIGK